jgi:hypothetical protein
MEGLSSVCIAGGYMFLTVPSPTASFRWQQGSLDKNDAADFGDSFNRFLNHKHYFEKSSIYEISDRHGFDVLECFSYLSSHTQRMLDALSPFTMATHPAARREFGRHGELLERYLGDYFFELFSPIVRADSKCSEQGAHWSALLQKRHLT